jgi:hypothetical protein
MSVNDTAAQITPALSEEIIEEIIACARYGEIE